MIQEVTERNFEKFIQTDKLVILDFWADWCQPCKVTKTMLEQIADNTPYDIVVGTVDCDEHDELVQKFSIKNLPTIKLMRDKDVVATLVGSISRDTLEAMIKKHSE